MKNKKNKKYQIGGNKYTVNNVGFNNTPYSTQIDKLDISNNGFNPLPISAIKPKFINPEFIDMFNNYNLDSDGEYRKNVYEEDMRNLQFNPFFQVLNPLLDSTRFIANNVNNIKTLKKERKALLDAQRNDYMYNVNEAGVNNIPVYYQVGGKVPLNYEQASEYEKNNLLYNLNQLVLNQPVQQEKSSRLYAPTNDNYLNGSYIKGWESDPKLNNTSKEQPYTIEVQEFVYDEKGRRTLDRNIIGKKQFSNRKDFYKYIQDNKELIPVVKQGNNQIYIYSGKDKDKYKDLREQNNYSTILKEGDNVNTTGYLPQYETSNNPYNIIPSNNITMNNVPIGIMAVPNNGNPTYLPPNSGNYTFPNAKYVTEYPIRKQTGGSTEQDQVSQIIQIYAQLSNTTPDNLMQQLQKLQPEEQQQVLEKMYNEIVAMQEQQATNQQPQQLQKGGEVLEVESEGEGNIELEKGEVFKDNNGMIQKVAESEPTHEEGGSLHPNASKVLEDTSDKRNDKVSKLLKIKPEDAEELVGFKPKTSVSHSKLFELATEYYVKKLKKAEKAVNDNIDYLKKINDKHAVSSLDENTKILESIPTEHDIFNMLYNNQENIKAKYNIDQPQKFQDGGNAGEQFVWQRDKYVPTKTPYKVKPKGYNDPAYISDLMRQFNKILGTNYPTTQEGLTQMRSEQGTTYPEFIKHAGDLGYWNRNKTNDVEYIDAKRGYYDGVGAYQQTFTSQQEYDDYVKLHNAQRLDPNNPNSLYWIDPESGRYIGVRTSIKNPIAPPPSAPLDPNDPIYSGMIPSDVPLSINTDIPTNTNTITDQPNNNSDINIKFNKRKEIEPSKFNEPLRWFDVAGAINKYIDSEREPVSLEQLSRQPLQVREVNPLPTLLQNQGDYNAILEQLPTNGVGMANLANLGANKYKANNDVLGNYENINKQKRDQIDQYNDQNRINLDQLNMQLRDTFSNRILQGREIQRRQRLEALDGLYNKIALNRKLNREGDLILKLSPFFDQYGNFNYNNFDITGLASTVESLGGKTEEITKGGKQYIVIKDGEGKVIKEIEKTKSK